MEHPIPVGAIVKALRLAGGRDQVPFAEQLGISQGHLSKIERGQGQLAVEPWANNTQTLAVGTPPPEASHEDYRRRAWPLFLLVLPVGRAEHPGAVRLLAGEDGQMPVFLWAFSALFAGAVFERMCAPEVCVIPVWNDVVSRIAEHGQRPVVVPAPQDDEDRDVIQVNLDELAAATTIARAWLLESKVRQAEARKLRSAPDFDKAIDAYGRRFGSKWSPPADLPPDSLAIVDAAEKETLWPPTA